MSQDNMIKLDCSQCKRRNYFPHKNKQIKGKLELKKFCKFCAAHTLHIEAK